MFEQIGKILPKTVKKMGISSQIKSISACEEASKALQEIFPGQKSKMDPVSLKNGVLSIRVSGSSLSQEIEMRKKRIMRLINEFLGKDEIKEIRLLN